MLRKRLVALASAAALGLSLAQTPANAEDAAVAAEAQIEELGVPLTTVRNTMSAPGYWTDGRPVLYAVAGQAEQALQFVVFDLATGEQLDLEVVEEVAQAYTVLVGPDDRVYIGGWGPAGTLLRYDPSVGEMENLGVPLPDDVVITQLELGEDGLIYGGGYPAGKVFSFDPRTDELEDLGVAIEGEEYSRALQPSPHGLFVGSESAQMKLTLMDPETGERTDIPSADWAQSETRHYDLQYANGLLFSYSSPSLDWSVYDVEAGVWIDRIEKNAQGGMTPMHENGKTYFVNNANGLSAYDTEARTSEPVGWDVRVTSAMGASGIGLLDLEDSAWPGETVVGLGNRGEIWKWNPETEQGEVVNADSPTFPVTTRSLGIGSDGNVYIGGSTGQITVGAFDVETDEFLHFTGGPQARVDAWGVIGDKTYFTTYGQAILFEYDPSQPYVYGRNPKQIFSLYSEYHQERIYALEVLDDGTSMLLGTIGGRGVNTGQLFHYDTATGQRTDLGAPVEGLNVSTLVQDGNLVWGGTSTEVLGTDPGHDEAHMFLWDLEAGAVVWDGVPVEGAKDIGELIVGDDGKVFGLTSQGNVFRMDPETRQVEATAEIGEPGGVYGHGTLEFGQDGYLYGSTMLGEVFVLDTETMDSKVLAKGEYAVFDGEGRLYFSEQGVLYRLTPSDDPFGEDSPVETSFAIASAALAGQPANAWGTAEQGATVRTQVQLPDGRWATSQIVQVGEGGRYVIPLTYGSRTPGEYLWRVQTNHGDGSVEVSEPLEQIRRAAPIIGHVDRKPVGQTTYVWGKVDVEEPTRVWTQVRIDGRWVRSQTVMTDADGRFTIELTYGKGTAGAHEFRVGAVYPDIAWNIHSEPFTLTRV